MWPRARKKLHDSIAKGTRPSPKASSATRAPGHAGRRTATIAANTADATAKRSVRSVTAFIPAS